MRHTKNTMARPKTGRNGERTNLYLSKAVKDEAARVAISRYGMSLSDLVEGLLRKEISLKLGVLKGLGRTTP
jgi:hypothetical protein